MIGSSLMTPWQCLAILLLFSVKYARGTNAAVTIEESGGTQPPTSPPTTRQCVTSLNDIYHAEKNVKDDSVLRKYILCPNTEFLVSLNFADDGTPLDGQYPIPVGRPNIQVLCGEDGRSENNCKLVRGLVHVGIVDEFSAGTPAYNVLLQGITFFRANSVNVIAMIGGHITIRDCIFQRNRNVASIYAVMSQSTRRRLTLTSNHSDITEFLTRPSRRTQDSQNQNVTDSSSKLHFMVLDSVFTDNVLGASPGAETTAVIYSVGASIEMFDSAIVGTTKDALKAEAMPNLIHIEGASMTIRHNCFVGNDPQISPVIAKNSSVDARSNFNQRTSSLLPASGCEFVANNIISDFATTQKGFVCDDSDAPVCTNQNTPNFRFPCVSYLDEMYFSEKNISDPRVPRTYLLCPDTVFRVGSRNQDDGTPIGGSYPIILGRPNVRVLCGVHGKFSDNCQLLNGVVQVALFDEFQTDGVPITGALVQGISFSGASSINALISSEGDVIFRDCEFKENDNVAAVYVQVMESNVRARRKLTSTLDDILKNPRERRTQTQQTITNLMTARLESCIFTNNSVGSAINPISGLISNYDATLTITDNMIVNTINKASPNYLGYYEVSYLIGNFGGQMSLTKNCYFDNQVTIAPVINTGNITAMFNSGRQAMEKETSKPTTNVQMPINSARKATNGTNSATGPLVDHVNARCEFIATVAGVLGEENPELVAVTCNRFDTSDCPLAEAPTPYPTMAPTITPRPSTEPSVLPTTHPTVPMEDIAAVKSPAFPQFNTATSLFLLLSISIIELIV